MYDPDRHHRRSIRLQGYDYTASGAYFITIVTYGRVPRLAQYQNGVLALSVAGQIATERWFDLPQHHPTVALDTFVIMPDHIHGVLVLTNASNNGPPNGGSGQPRSILSGTIGTIVGSYKSSVTRQVHALSGSLGMPFWQRNYYEHIVRDDDDLARIRKYIHDNPDGWIDRTDAT